MDAPIAHRVAVLVDGEAYFSGLAQCLRMAQKRIHIIGWDFDAGIVLEPRVGESLGHMLRSLVEARPHLEVRVLVWSAAVVHAPGASLPLLFHELRRVHGELGSVAGRLYSWNTIGNLVGALLGGYALLYWLDLHHVYRLGVAAVVILLIFGVVLVRMISGGGF